MSVVTAVPHTQIPGAMLSRLLESFITREGTDYGEVERSLSEKVDDLLKQLKRGEIVIVFDGESESFNLLPRAEARALGVDLDALS